MWKSNFLSLAGSRSPVLMVRWLAPSGLAVGARFPRRGMPASTALLALATAKCQATVGNARPQMSTAYLRRASATRAPPRQANEPRQLLMMIDSKLLLLMRAQSAFCQRTLQALIKTTRSLRSTYFLPLLKLGRITVAHFSYICMYTEEVASVSEDCFIQSYLLPNRFLLFKHILNKCSTCEAAQCESTRMNAIAPATTITSSNQQCFSCFSPPLPTVHLSHIAELRG